MQLQSHATLLAIHLPSNGALAQFTDAERRALAQVGELVSHEPGSVVIDQAQPQNALYIVLTGRLEVISGPANVLAELGEGEMFGEMALLDPPYSKASVIAVLPSELWRIQRDPLRQFISLHPAAGAKLMSVMMAKFGQRV